MKSRTLNILLTIGLLAVIALNIRTCNSNRQFSNSVGDIINYEDSAKVYKSKNGELVYYNTSLEVSLKELAVAKDSLMKLVKDIGIKKPKSITQVITKISYVDVPVYYTDTIPCDTFAVPFTYTDEWLAIHGISNNDGLNIQRININSGLTIVTGEKKNGLFKRNEQVVSVVSDNPHLRVTNLTNYNIKPKVPFYDKWWFKGALFGGGVILGTKL
jgi:regulatory protein YycH of two-component signal transduction system YycFG